MKSVRRRGTTPLAALFASAVIVASTLSPLAARVAAGQSIQQTRAEIASLSAQLARQEKSSEVTANAYDAQKAQLDTLTADIHALQTQEVAERALVIRTTRHMVKAVVRSYVYGTTNDQVIALFNQNVGANDSRQVFERLVVGNLNGLRIKLDHQRTKLFGEIATLSSEHARANATARNLQALLAQNIAAADQTRATLTSVTATLKNEIIAYEVAAGAAAARTRDTAAESSAIAAASEVGGQAAANQVLAAIAANTPPPTPSNQVSGSPAGSAQGEAAVAWAEKQEGVPYVWGGETPGVGFDCSGLVQWAWGKVGFTIPRTTEAQWAALPHIPLTQLRPGDLLYYYNLDGDGAVDHVVMYVGSGPWGTNTIIAAAYTGTNISLAPIFTGGLIGAARP